MTSVMNAALNILLITKRIFCMDALKFVIKRLCMRSLKKIMMMFASSLNHH